MPRAAAPSQSRSRSGERRQPTAARSPTRASAFAIGDDGVPPVAKGRCGQRPEGDRDHRRRQKERDRPHRAAARRPHEVRHCREPRVERRLLHHERGARQETGDEEELRPPTAQVCDEREQRERGGKRRQQLTREGEGFDEGRRAGGCQ